MDQRTRLSSPATASRHGPGRVSQTPQRRPSNGEPEKRGPARDGTVTPLGLDFVKELYIESSKKNFRLTYRLGQSEQRRREAENRNASLLKLLERPQNRSDVQSHRPRGEGVQRAERPGEGRPFKKADKRHYSQQEEDAMIKCVFSVRPPAGRIPVSYWKEIQKRLSDGDPPIERTASSLSNRFHFYSLNSLHKKRFLNTEQHRNIAERFYKKYYPDEYDNRMRLYDSEREKPEWHNQNDDPRTVPNPRTGRSSGMVMRPWGPVPGPARLRPFDPSSPGPSSRH